MILELRAAPPFMTNGFVLGCADTRAGIIIDPGDNVDALIDTAQAMRLSIEYILLTHAHLDHITGVSRAKEAFDVPIALHRDDLPLYDAIVEQGRWFGLQLRKQAPIDMFLDPDEEPITFGHYEIHTHHTPGHSPGGVCFEIRNQDESDGNPTLIVGDTLFAGSVGRVDLPGGDMHTLLHSIRSVLFEFDDDCVVYPGHGDPTTIGRERRTNPFLA